MTNRRQCYLLKLKNKNCQNIKRLSHSFYIFQVKCIPILLFIYILFHSFLKQYFISTYTYIYNKIYGYFYFQIFTYHLSSLAHNATLALTYDGIQLSLIRSSGETLFHLGHCVQWSFVPQR